MRVTLRAATPSDRHFVETVYFETQRWIIEQLFGWRGDDTERAKFDESYVESETEIVNLSGDDVGWLSVHKSASSVEIDSIYILPQAQKMGIGTMLISRIIHDARATGLTVTISTAKINPARTLYQRLGFQVCGETELKVFMRYRQT